MKNGQGHVVYTITDWSFCARECVIKHGTMLQTAGCLRHLSSLEEKEEIKADYLRWYIIDRNSSVIDR